MSNLTSMKQHGAKTEFDVCPEGQKLYVYSNVSAGLLYVETPEPLDSYCICDGEGKAVDCPLLISKPCENGFVTTFDASALTPWAVHEPVLYTIEANGEIVRFGHTEIKTMQNKMILLNEKPIYLRGYIRGIIAHEHPNMTGGTDYEAACKNIRQAKKYGFNLVRFHTTVPSEDFLRAADELGLLVHVETGFLFERTVNPETGKPMKRVLDFGEGRWENTVRSLRNHPSVAVFCIGNEMHCSAHFPEVHEMVALGRKLAPNKIIMDNCGWGEYDRDCSDMFIQHMGYYLPYAHHADMFTSDICWKEDESAYSVPLKLISKTASADTQIDRYAMPLKPVLSHEAMHYVDIVDYEALEKKFDDFCEKVGPEYLEKHGIKKPKYFAGLKKLVEMKDLKDLMPDYIAATRKFRLVCTKIFLETLRMSHLCGHEMLQLSDCLKYENKNGFIDFFDDDKGIDSDWVRQINGDLVLLAAFEKERLYEDEDINVKFFASDFLPECRVNGTLEITLDGEVIYNGKQFALAGGLQQLASLNIKAKPVGKSAYRTLAARFVYDDQEVKNSWKIWTYPRVRPQSVPEMSLTNQALADYLSKGSKKSDLYVTDALDQKLLDKLAEGKTALLLYNYQAQQNTWDVQASIERFKPCIWDRGNGLGGILANKAVEEALGDDRYFDKNVQPLLDVSCKINLDTWPWAVTEHVQGVDKPIRDRYKGLQQGIKDFLPEDTLRRFCHLLSVKIGDGTLVICTFNVSDPENPVVSNLLELLIDRIDAFAADTAIDAAEFKAWLEKVNAEGFREEDRMNRIWENDKIPVERVLFWEDLNVNLAAIKQ